MSTHTCHSEERRRRGIPGFLPRLSPGLKANALAGFAALLLLTTAAQGGEQKLGSYTLYYSTQNTVELSPEIARQYGIDRLPRVALLLVNIRDANGKAVVAAVSGKARNLLGQTQSLTTRKIEEGTAISYITLFEISHLDTQSFDLEIRPADSTQVLNLRFSQQFFVD